MNNSQVAKNWRKQTGKMKNGHSMYYNGKTIFSYGSHFPMAIITDSLYEGKTIIIQNSNSYSNSTAKHQNHMRGECYNDAIVKVSTRILEKFVYFLQYNYSRTEIARIKKEAKLEIEGRIIKTSEKMGRARTRKEWYARDIASDTKELEILKRI